jgi:predicted TIM-barrel fold metal-dependent hydrolase
VTGEATLRGFDITRMTRDPIFPFRRRILRVIALSPLLLYGAAAVAARQIPPVEHLKAGYRRRMTEMLGRKALPYIDVESSANSDELDIEALAKTMDALDIGLMALSATISSQQYKRGVRYDPLSVRLVERYPERFIPVGNGGVPPAWTQDPEAFVAENESQVRDGNFLMMGEFEFRHYPSPRQVKRGEDRDVTVPIDGEIGHRLFRLSEASGVSFQIHYEIEDGLLPPLEKMLAAYPKAKVIWCHLAQVRYIERASRYSPAYVEGLIRKFPNLYFDTAFGGPNSVYPLSRQRHARVWAGNGGLRADWLELLVAYPQRFLAALDLGGDRMHRIREWDSNFRYFLNRLPAETQHHVAYRSAWKLLFNEDFT